MSVVSKTLGAIIVASFGTSVAQAAPSLKPGEMKSAVEYANSSFKSCVAQSNLYADGVSKLSRSDLSSAKKANKSAAQALAQRLNPVTAQPQPRGGLRQVNLGSLIGANQLGGNQQVVTPQGLVFSLGNGYSNQIQSWLQPFNAGDPLRAAALLAHEGPTKVIQQRKYRKDPSLLADETVANKIGVLGLVERATVSLSGGDLECTVNFLDYGIQASERQQASSFWRSDLEQYEHIMAVNLKAIGYLLAGDERARNMAQASRELQGRARAEYANMLEQEQQKAQSESVNNGLPNQMEWLALFEAAYSNSALAMNSQAAARMTSPYVNPLADYLSAVVAETEASAGTGTLDEWSRASIAWKNASELAPTSGFLSAASNQTNGWQRSAPPNGKKIVNVLVATGSAPTDVVSKMYFNYQGAPFPVMMPMKASQENQFAGGEIIVGGDSASLEIVSDVEGMIMRSAEDQRGTEMLSALMRGWVAFEAGNAVGANSDSVLGNVLGSAVRDTLAEPSTDSWSSLPSSFYAARLVVPVDQSQVTVSIAGAGTQSFELVDDQATFVFASSKNNRLWGQAQRAKFGGDRLEFEVQ